MVSKSAGKGRRENKEEQEKRGKRTGLAVGPFRLSWVETTVHEWEKRVEKERKKRGLMIPLPWLGDGCT